MTCIVAIAHKGKVYMGGDGAGTDSSYGQVRRIDKKVFKNGDYLMGFTDSFRMGQLLAYKLTPPEPHPGKDLYAFMVTDFVEAVRDCLKAGGYSKVLDNEETGGNFLVGYKGRLFEIGGDYQVGESHDKYNAVGCGEDLALGALYVTASRPPKERITLALNAACHHSAGCAGPYTILST